MSEVRKWGPWRIALVLVVFLPVFALGAWRVSQDPGAASMGKPLIIMLPLGVVCLIALVIEMARKKSK